MFDWTSIPRKDAKRSFAECVPKRSLGTRDKVYFPGSQSFSITVMFFTSPFFPNSNRIWQSSRW